MRLDRIMHWTGDNSSRLVAALAALLCLAAVPASAQFAGVWDSSYGKLRLHHVDGYVIGDYADVGILLGKVEGKCVAGVFTNGGRNGTFRFELSGDESFEGRWAWHGESLNRAWEGTLADAEPPTRLHNFTRGSSTTQTVDNERTVTDGTYDSEFGTVSLFARDLFLVGDYAEKGILAGMWDGNSYVGRFTNGSDTGWFDFAFLSKTGTFREGSWGWIGREGGGEWSLDRTGGATPSPHNMVEDVSCPQAASSVQPTPPTPPEIQQPSAVNVAESLPFDVGELPELDAGAPSTFRLCAEPCTSSRHRVRPHEAGTLKVEARWTGSAEGLSLALRGPGPETYARSSGQSPLSLQVRLTESMLEKEGTWWVLVGQPAGGEARGELSITLPGWE